MDRSSYEDFTCPKKVNEILVQIKQYHKKLNMAESVTRAMRDCGYSKEKINQVLERMYSEIDRTNETQGYLGNEGLYMYE